MPIQFGGGGDGLSDEPGPIQFGSAPAPKPKIMPTPAAGADFDFEAGPAISLPSYITRAAQSWDPDSPARAKAKAPEPEPPPLEAPPPPAFRAPVEPPPEPEPPQFQPPPPDPFRPPEPPPRPVVEDEPPVVAYQPPPRRRTVPRPEPTYGVLKPEAAPAPKSKRSAQPELPLEPEVEPKRYFTPLPEPGRSLVVTPPPPPVAPPPAAQLPAVDPAKPLIQIQINSLPPMFKGSGLIRGLFFGCLMGVAVGGIAAVLLDLLAPHPNPLPVPEKSINAEVLSAPVEAPPEPKRAARKSAKGYERPVVNSAAEPPPTIRVQSAPPPRAVIRQGSGQPLTADPNSGR